MSLMPALALRIPKMKINGYQAILDLEEIDRFTRTNLEETTFDLTVHVNSKGKKYFVIHSPFRVYGWTEDPNKAFHAWGNLEMYNANEIYEMMRGRNPF